MNRVIKFRGLCAISEGMVFGDLIHGVGYKHGSIYILPDVTNLAYVKHCDPLDGVKVIPETVGQYAVVKDLYEGDIYHMGDPNIKYEVVWHDSGLIGKQIGSSSYAGLEHWENEIKLLGNIHENPELLK